MLEEARSSTVHGSVASVDASSEGSGRIRCSWFGVAFHSLGVEFPHTGVLRSYREAPPSAAGDSPLVHLGWKH